MTPVDTLAPQSTFLTKSVTFTVSTTTVRPVTITAAVDSTGWGQLQLDNVALWRE